MTHRQEGARGATARSAAAGLVCLALCFAAPGAAFTAGAIPPPAPAPAVGLDAATARAAELQRQLGDLRAEYASIAERITVTDRRIGEQSAAVARAHDAMERAQQRFDARIVEIYKAGHTDPLILILSARTLRDVVDAGTFMLDVAQRDQLALEEASQLAAQAAYEANVLDGMRSEQVLLRRIGGMRLSSVRSALGEQQRLVATLTARQRAYVEAAAKADTEMRRAFAASSVATTTVARVPALIEPYLDRVYYVDAGEPTRYVTAGPVTTELCSWYGNAENGLATASGRDYNENEFTCASKTLPFGTRVALSRGDQHVVVIVTDRGPYVAGRSLDLSKAAAHALGFDGVAACDAQIVVPK